MSARHVAIVGGGFSGALQAVQLVRAGVRVTLIERAGRLARGVAYSTRHAEHLLNVRAAGMSAFPDRPDDFADWLAARGEGDGASFAQRRVYGAYVEQLLAAARAEAGDRLKILAAEAVDVVANGGEVVRCADGDSVSADAVVLSIGNLAPETPRAIDPSALGESYVADPWAGDIAAGLGARDTIFLIGTGLTAIDAALMLDAAGFGGQIVAVSRRGLVPRAHADAAAAPALAEPPGPRCSTLLRGVRRETAAIGWRSAVDQLRPVTQQLWASAPLAERRRFLRHLRPYWDVHRHRIAPEIAARIEAMERRGRLAFHAGKILQATPGEVRWRPRGVEEVRRLRTSRIVNCTGPQGDIARAREPLLTNLIKAGRIRPDPCRIGIDVDAGSHTFDVAGRASSTLYAIGPMTRGAFWEIVAAPDIRAQVAALAGLLAAKP